MDSTLADKVLKKTPLDLQKRFPKNHVSQILGGPFCGSAFPENGFAVHQDLDEVGKLVDRQRGIVHCVLIQHLHAINFILQFLKLASEFKG